MTNTSQTPEQILNSWCQLCQIDSLNKIYEEKFKHNTTKGIDRINGSQFEKQAQSQIQVIHDKCLSGTYKFSPYLEYRLSKERRQEVLDFAVFCVRGSYRIDCRGDPPHTINIAQPLILSGRPASGKLFGI